ncbi:hypothetical protein DIPPA_26909 [Diplonema papillatum]|nr:hypothetical protein DIPPA_26909 [Diplonema papillatum]
MVRVGVVLEKSGVREFVWKQSRNSKLLRTTFFQGSQLRENVPPHFDMQQLPITFSVFLQQSAPERS